MTHHSYIGAEKLTKIMNEIPKDPFILYSWVNLKLRDFYPNLDALCDDLQVEKEALKSKLSAAGFKYDENQNKFI